MKIFTSISYYKPHVSGLTICAQRLIDGLSKKDFNFTVLTSRHKNNLLKNETENNIKIIRSPVLMTLGKVPIMPRYLFQTFREIKKSGLVWIHLPQVEGLAALIIAKILNKPIVSTVHCLPLLPFGLNKILFQRLFDWLNNVIVRFSDRVVYYTKDYAENTKELLRFPSKSEYIFPPIPPFIFNHLNHPNHFNHSPYVTGFAGRVAEDKGLEYLLETLSQLNSQGKKVDLIIAGNMEAVGEKSYSTRIKNLLQTIDFKVEFAGEIKPDNMSEFYRRIDLLVMPSVNRTEAFGIVQAEAMLSGIPVVASDLPGVRIPIKLAGEGFIVNPRDIQALSRAIWLCLQKNIDRAGLARKAAIIFNQEKTFSAYAEIFRQTKN